MKRYLTFALALLLVFSLVGCKQTAAEPTTVPTETTVPTQATEPTETTPEITGEQQPMAAIVMPVITEEKTAEDGTVLLSYVYQNITLTVPDPEVADKVIVDFLNRTDHHDTADSLFAAAQKAYSQGTAMSDPYICSTVYAPMRIDLGVLSLFGSFVAYEGGAHGSQASTAVSYDLLTGNTLAWKDILQDGVTADQVCQLVLEALENYEAKSDLFPDYADTVKNIFSQGLQNHTDWYFSVDGLCCFFSPYEIGPFAAGTIVAEIPYNKLVGVLKDEYFPPERDTLSDSLTVADFDPDKLTDFTQFTEIVLDENAKQTIVYTYAVAYDVRLEVGSISSFNGKFIPEHTVLGCSTLTPGDAIMIQAATDDPECALRLTYTANGEAKELLLTK
ncbi:MAG: DUF3298 domain-containing protein [Oscillospiraceae bacterium]|nr:DUF3298 domain-containing protein [Oscillospiraceae bacterium]